MNRRQFPRLGETCFEAELDNGLHICVVPRSGYLKSYAFFATSYGGMNLRFRTEEGWQDSPAGVAHFLEHKLFETKEGNALQMFSVNGASPNAFTGADLTGYYFECTDKFEENLRLLLSFVSEPYFTPESVEKEQGIIEQEIQMIEDNPDWCLYQNLLRALYQQHPIRIPLAGSKASIAEITVDALYQCHQAFYHPGNMILCVVGDVDPEQVAAIAQEVLPTGHRGRTEKDLGKPESTIPAKKRIVQQMEVSSPNFLLGMKATPHPEGEENLRLQLLGDLAGEVLAGDSSPLYAKLYSTGLIDKSFFVSYESYPNAAFLVMGGESKQVDAVVAAILEEGERIQKDGIDPGLFCRCKKAAYGSRVRALNSMEHVCVRLVEGKMKGYHYYRFADLYDQITVEEVQYFLEHLISPAHAALSVVEPKEVGSA